MFRKPFSVRSNTQLRNSDSRKLLKRLPDETANRLPKKANIAQVKISLVTQAQLNVYTFDKEPLLFDDSPKSALMPTLYATWADPGFCPILLVHEQVFTYLENGADLMLPGVIRSSTFPTPRFEKGAPVAVATLARDGQIRGPVAIGCALLSSDAMDACKMQGKGIQIVHVFRDHLWEMGSRAQPPVIDMAALVKDLSRGELPDSVIEEVTEGVRKIGDEGALEVEHRNDSVDSVPEVSHNEHEQCNSEDVVEEPAEQLLLRCFLAGIRYRLGKSAQLPFDVGQFYSQCLLKSLPEGKRLDVKKTKYKKFANFLTDVNKSSDGPVVKVSSKGKGVDVISEVNWTHPLLTNFKATDERIRDESADGKSSIGPRITEFCAVTDAVMPLLSTQGKISRGDLLTPSVVREMVTVYVKNEGLNKGKQVRLDPLLSGVSGITSAEADWNTLVQKVISKMTKTYVMDMPDGRRIVKKIKMPKIVLKVETRSGNKKVTLVDNVAAFGLDPKEIAQKLQVGVAASATFGDAPCCEGLQITVQGNQVAFLDDLLTNTYGIDRKYVEGLDLAPKKKK